MCGKEGKFMVYPSRHLLSPNRADFTNTYCSKECQKARELECYVFYANIDRNASDSQCFEHIRWVKDNMGRQLRYGRCRITNKEYAVEPLQPGENSGQPIECYNHFQLLKQYEKTQSVASS